MNKFNPKVSVVFPSYNEKENVAEAARRTVNALGDILHEIIFVDDNSPDGTWKIIGQLSKKDPRVKLIHRIEERGLASAIKRGVDEATGNVIVWMDCDLALPPEMLPQLVGYLDSYDIAMGSRYVEGGKDERGFFRSALSRMFNIYANVLLNFKVKDYSSGFIAVKREVVEEIPLNPVGFGEYFLDFIYRCTLQDKKIKEIGFVFKNREKGVSKCDESYVQLFIHGFNFGKHVLKMRFAFGGRKNPESLSR